jgi:hypothetical protein
VSECNGPYRHRILVDTSVIQNGTVSCGILQLGESRGVLQRITATKTRSLGALKPLTLLSTCDVISGYGDCAALRHNLVGAAQKCDIKLGDFFWVICDYSTWNFKTEA